MQKEKKWNCEHNLKTDEKSLSKICDFHCGAVKHINSSCQNTCCNRHYFSTFYTHIGITQASCLLSSGQCWGCQEEKKVWIWVLDWFPDEETSESSPVFCLAEPTAAHRQARSTAARGGNTPDLTAGWTGHCSKFKNHPAPEKGVLVFLCPYICKDKLSKKRNFFKLQNYLEI